MIGESYDQTMQCVENSFEPAKKGEELWQRDNTILKENYKQWIDYGILYYPSVMINKVSYRGDIIPINIAEAICASLWSQPDFCIDFYIEEHIEMPINSHNSIVTAEMLIGVTATLIAVNLGLICAYKRCAKKEMEQDIGH